MVSIEIAQKMEEHIRKYVNLGRFKNVDDFVQQAIQLMLYAEDNKEAFTKIIKED